MKDEITQYVLLNKKTGDLLVGAKVCFVGRSCDITNEKYGYVVTILHHDGWVITHSGLTAPIFMNRHCEKFIEVLGEI